MGPGQMVPGQYQPFRYYPCINGLSNKDCQLMTVSPRTNNAWTNVHTPPYHGDGEWLLEFHSSVQTEVRTKLNNKQNIVAVAYDRL